MVKGFFRRLSARRRMKKDLSLWYHPAYEVPELARTARTRGIVPDRGRNILSHLVQMDLIRPGDVEAPTGASIRDLRLCHTQEYLEAVNQPETLGRIFGLEPAHIDVDRILRAQRMAVGGTLAATGAVLDKAFPVAFNLGGGFHHAEPDRGSGFCVFNDVAVSVAKLRQKEFSSTVAVIDLDFHQGNGNDRAFAKDPTVAQFSIEGSTWAPQPPDHLFHFKLPEGTNDEAYLDLLREKLPEFLAKKKPKLIFYIAGNDVLELDPLGEFNLSVEGVLQRDKMVAEAAHDRGIPLVITLAGGYSRHACLCSLNLILYLVGYQQEIICDIDEELHHYFSKISESLDPTQLQKEDWDNLNISSEDISVSLRGPRTRQKILDYYSAHGVELALERYGFLPRLREMGYRSLKVTVDPSDPSHQLIRVEGRPKDELRSVYANNNNQNNKQPHEVLLAEVVVRKEVLPFPLPTNDKKPLELLTVEWLLLQDPLKKFTPQNPEFPGQKHPGLGLAEEVQELLQQIAKRLKLDGILIRPSFFHIAAGAEHFYHFIDPKLEGTYQAIRETLRDEPMARASREVHEDRMRLDDGTVLKWKAGDQICPMSERLKDYFASRDYAETALEEKHRLLQSGLHAVS